MSHTHVPNQNQDVWLAADPENVKNHLLSLEDLLIFGCHRSSSMPSICMYTTYLFNNIKIKYSYDLRHACFYHDLREKYNEIADMYSNAFGIEYHDKEIKNKWLDLINYVKEDPYNISS